MNILLLTSNYIYEQRWVILGSLGYALFLTIVYGLEGGNRSELSAFLIQQAIWAATFALLIASSTLAMDLRTRRVLGVLSKAVYRWEYLAGIVLSAWVIIACYFSIVLIACLTVPHLKPALTEASIVAGCVLMGALVAITAVIATTLLLPAFFATLAATAVVIFPGMLVASAHRDPTWVSPAAACALLIANQGKPSFELLMAVIVHTLLWFAVGNLVFSRRDIAAASE